MIILTKLMSIIFVIIAMLSKISFPKNKNMPTYFQFVFLVDSTKKWILFLFCPPPRLNFFEKKSRKTNNKKCWPNALKKKRLKTFFRHLVTYGVIILDVFKKRFSILLVCLLSVILFYHLLLR